MFLIGIIFKAILTGLFLGLGFGTVFFAIIQASISRGFKAGMAIALGVLISDIFLVTLVLGFKSFIDSVLDKHQDTILLLGGIALLCIGLYNLRHFSIKKVEVVSSKVPYTLLIGKGMFLNLSNPANFGMWLGVFATVGNIKGNWSIVFALITLSAVFLTEIGIAASAVGLSKFLKATYLRKINMLVSWIFILVGLKFIVSYFL